MFLVRNIGAHRQNARLSSAIAALSAALILSACGGGGDDTLSSRGFTIDVVAGGQVLMNDTPVVSGGSLDVVIRAGAALVVDAGEPVVWTLLVGGSAITLGGTGVHYAGVDISASTLSPSAISVDTFAAFQLAAPVSMTLVATSTFDSTQVATINLLFTN